MANFWGFDPINIDGLVFASYNSHDWKRVKNIALELRKLGVPVWYDYGLMAGTDEWATQISVRIKMASAVVIFVTKGIFERKNSYVIHEYRQAKMLGVPIIPVFLDDVTDRSFLRTIDAKYLEHISSWKALQGVPATADDIEQNIASNIKLALDKSDEINYTPVPYVDAEAEKKKAEEAKRKLEEEAKRKADEENDLRNLKLHVEMDRMEQTHRYDPQSVQKPVPPAPSNENKQINKPVATTNTHKQVPFDDSRKHNDGKKRGKAWVYVVAALCAVIAVLRGGFAIAGNRSATCEYLDTTKTYSVGAHLLFGNYEQDADESNGAEPIEWRVINVKKDSMLLISEYLLDCKRFDAASNDWQSSELRAWLNGEFMNSAFSAIEQQRLTQYKGDSVTCLSVDDVEWYFRDDTKEVNEYTTYPDRVSKPTEFAILNGCFADPNSGTGWWWLRSPGDRMCNAAYVDYDGDIFSRGNSTNCDITGVRPVVSILL